MEKLAPVNFTKPTYGDVGDAPSDQSPQLACRSARTSAYVLAMTFQVLVKQPTVGEGRKT
jgi:hypothetical protein